MMLNEAFSDYFAHKDNFLTRIDARIKMIFIFAAIITTLLSRTPLFPAIFAFFCLGALLSIRIPPRIILMRLSAPLGMAAIIALITVFALSRVHLSAFKDALLRGLLTASKIMGCVSLAALLGMTTSVNSLLKAGRWFGIPKTWIEIAAITYRYVFVMIEDAVTIRDAQMARLGYSDLSRTIRSLAELAGSLFIRAYDRSISTYEAMRSRGYLEDK